MIQPTDRPTRLSDDDLHLFNEGTHFGLGEHLGAHPMTVDGVAGTWFAVWAPNAASAAVTGDFHGWSRTGHPLAPRGRSGIWEGFVPGVGQGDRYKFRIRGRNGYEVLKADPFARHAERAPATASIVWQLDYEWRDADWMAQRAQRNALDAPISIYELHVGSWRHDDDGRPLGYRELAPLLCRYLVELGFTHVEFLPITEHPFGGSWGYQTTGYFAPQSCFGTPQDLMFLIDELHRAGIGVILDWVPSHFPSDEHGLVYFDGTHLYEHADPRQGMHPDWRTCIFNLDRHEVRSFLISSAMFWLGRYHFDGIRVDAVASMLYLDYSRKQGEWIPNERGGRENLGAIEFLRRLNTEVYRVHPGVQMIAEESTSWPLVTRPVHDGGLGFGLKWDMGWMHDTLRYMTTDPLFRKGRHRDLTFRGLYAFHENFVLPLSHDEVVHLKGSLLGKMPGDEWQRFANLRLLYCAMWTQPGKKLLFMGGEFGQRAEWNYEASLEWHLLADPRHAGVQRLVADLNRLYRELPALHELDVEPAGFGWLDPDDDQHSCLTFLRHGRRGDAVVVALNLTPVPRNGYRVGVPHGGEWREILNSDASPYGGSGHGNLGAVVATDEPANAQPFSVALTLPPLAAVLLAEVTGKRP